MSGLCPPPHATTALLLLMEEDRDALCPGLGWGLLRAVEKTSIKASLLTWVTAKVALMQPLHLVSCLPQWPLLD